MTLSVFRIHYYLVKLLHVTSSLIHSIFLFFKSMHSVSPGRCPFSDINFPLTEGGFSGNTPLMYGCAGGHEEVVKFLLEHGANVEDHNENGHTPLMEAASAGHVGLAKILLEHGAGINTHSNEFKESALTLACYKGHLDMVRFLLEAGADQVCGRSVSFTVLTFSILFTR